MTASERADLVAVMRELPIAFVCAVLAVAFTIGWFLL